MTVTTGPGGTFTVTDTPRTTTRYVIRSAGASSPSMLVVVRPKLTAGCRAPSCIARLVYVRGSVLPRATNQRVYLQRLVGRRG